MSYHTAKECFDENLQLLGQPQTDLQAWNLNTGLKQLAEALEADLDAIRTLLGQIQQSK